MWLCLCNAVNHETVIRAIDGGARSVRDIGRTCRAGTTCRGCVRTLAQVLSERRGAVGRRAAGTVDTLPSDK